MKHATEYAKRIKGLYHRLIRTYGRPPVTDATDPIEELLVGILAAGTTHTKARAAFRRLREQMVDLNELRVTPPSELAGLIGDALPLARRKAQRMVDALNAVRRREENLDLSFLRERSCREAREYLESLGGVDRAAAAGVLLYSLDGHAIPVDDLTVYVLRKEGLVAPSADAAEVQGFLERHIGSAEARAFAELMGRYVCGKAQRVPIEKLDELLNPLPAVPPAPPAPPQPPPVVKAGRLPAQAPGSAKKKGEAAVGEKPAGRGKAIPQAEKRAVKSEPAPSAEGRAPKKATKTKNA